LFLSLNGGVHDDFPILKMLVTIDNNIVGIYKNPLLRISGKLSIIYFFDREDEYHMIFEI